jgi:phosphoribulokinase
MSMSAGSPVTAQGLLLKNARERMDILAAYREVGSYRRAAAMCDTTHKTVGQIVERRNAGGAASERKDQGHNYEHVHVLVADRVRRSQGRISAKRLLAASRAAGYAGRPGTSAGWSPR